MIFKLKKRFYRPFYKQFIKLRKNVQNRPKLLKFKKKKWENFQFHNRRKLRFFTRFKKIDQFRMPVTRFSSKGNSFKKKFRNSLNERKLFSVFYGGLKKKYLKKKIQLLKSTKSTEFKFLNFKQSLLKIFESRLDTVVFRSRFSLSVKGARQLIFHGHILVNKIVVRTPSYILKTDDLIEVAYNQKSRNLVSKSVKRAMVWPIPPKYLIIKYSTLQILFLYNKNLNSIPKFFYYLNLDSVLSNIKRS